jgi:hypothetical protein
MIVIGIIGLVLMLLGLGSLASIDEKLNDIRQMLRNRQ